MKPDKEPFDMIGTCDRCGFNGGWYWGSNPKVNDIGLAFVSITTWLTSESAMNKQFVSLCNDCEKFITIGFEAKP